MLYISGYNKEKNLWAVTDTDDGAVEWLSKGDIFSTVKILSREGLKIEGVSGSSISVYSGSVNGAFDGVDWEGSLNKVAAEVDPLDVLKPRIKKLLSVAERISQVDKATFESTRVVFDTRVNSINDKRWFVLNIGQGPVADAGDQSIGFYRVNGRLVLGLGAFYNDRWSRSIVLSFYTDGNMYSQYYSYPAEVDYTRLEEDKKMFIKYFDSYERCFVAWFKKRYNS